MTQLCKTSILFLLILILSCSFSHAQQGQYNMSITNGFLSNHVYRVITDKYGFLWIATTKGAARYNGYTTTVFDASAGISNDDVWNIFEDNKGRIWLFSISDELGYIYEGVYHKVYVDDPRYIYPINITNTRNGVVFISGDRRALSYYCIEQNDSVKSYRIPVQSDELAPNCGITTNGDLITQFYNGDVFRTSMLNGRFSISKIGNYPPHNGHVSGKFFLPSIKRTPLDTQMFIIDIDDGSETAIPVMPDERPRLSVQHEGFHYISTNRNIYKVDNDLKYEKVYFEEDSNDMPGVFTSIIDDSLWGRCATTENKGLYLKLPSYTFKRSKEQYTTSVYVGSSADSCNYLWNEKDKRLVIVDKNRKTSYLSMPGINQVKKVLPFSSEISVMHTDNTLYEFNGSSYRPIFWSASRLYKKVDDSLQHQDFFLRNKDKELKLTDCFITPDSTICAAEISYGYSLYNIKGDSIIYNTLDGDRYLSIAAHLPSKTYIAYGRNNILVYNDTTMFKVQKSTLAQLGIKNIQKILVDNMFGNVLIHSNDKLFAYNIINNSFGLLFQDHNLKNAHILLYNGQVIAIGRFGIVSCKLSNKMKKVRTQSLINFKNSSYNHVHDAYVIRGNLFVNTDMGLYEVPIDEALRNDAFTDFIPPYKLFVATAGHSDIVSSGDTIVLDQNDPSLVFDFINPYGSGQLKYSYTVDGVVSSGRSLSEQINLPVLKPGEYYTLSVMVMDDLWKSRKYTLYLYTTPYWWQTDIGRWWIFIVALAVLIVLSSVAIVITRNILIRKHVKQSRYMELELKSIYAQLNPHFIFNTLGNIIYFVRQNRNTDAYRQLNMFSKLLRSYIRSSRNKWLSVAEEVENLNNYILLQKSRFEDKFDYSIDIDKELDPATMYIPTLLLQPIVENAIGHGLQPLKKQGSLLIRFAQGSDANTLVVTIDDNGIGRERSKEQKSNSINKTDSYGTSLLEDLVAIYKHYEVFKVDIEYIDKVLPDTGTTVIITIKYKL